jgi:hypothetical protein
MRGRRLVMIHCKVLMRVRERSNFSPGSPLAMASNSSQVRSNRANQGGFVQHRELGMLADPRIDRCSAGHARQLGDLVHQHAVADGLTDLGTEFDVVRAISAWPSFRR